MLISSFSLKLKIMNFLCLIKSSVVFGLVLMTSVAALAQSSEDYRQQEIRRLEAIKNGFDVFLNQRVSDRERIAAVAAYPIAKDPAQVKALKVTVNNSNASPAIRVVALRSVLDYIQGDGPFFNQVMEYLASPTTPKAFRDECLRSVGVVSFSAFGMQQVAEDILNVYRGLLTDKDINYRRDAYHKLAQGGDDVAQQNLINGLKDAQELPLPADECIRLLAYDIKGDYYPVIHEIAQSTSELKIKVAAIEVLGNYVPAREDIIASLNDTNESKEVRLAALKTLNAFDKENFTLYAEGVLQGPDAPVEVVIYAINAEKYRRLAPGFRQKSGDTFDQTVKALLNRQKSQQDTSQDLVRKSALNYLNTLGIEN